MRSLVPHIAVHASADADDIAEEKGFEDGLWSLLRPFGDQVLGKVTVRDSIGAGRGYDDFGIRFVRLGDGLGDSRAEAGRRPELSSRNTSDSVGGKPSHASNTAALRTGGNILQIEELVDRHLTLAERETNHHDPETMGFQLETLSGSISSPFYTLYLRRLLSGLPLSPHETFSHPIACVIAISSRNSSPIEALRQLYDVTTRGERRLPLWVNGGYLRYYLLVHDEDTDDISKSVALFEQMKRHFGLHCHLLRLRSSECASSDDDCGPVPTCEWISATEELALMEEEISAVENSRPFLYESDATAIKIFVREAVTQSVVPFMERCIATWNDQVASRRRGISGRFMSLSKKWAGFGSSSRSTSASGLGSSIGIGASNNYDPLQGFYRPDAPEATIRRLADYAFMLRDWKLAQTTYDLVRPDFNNDKAWKYYAGANEMAAISTLLSSQVLTTKVRAETVDQMLDTASYSYISRCAAPYSALRCLALGAELLKGRGGSATDDAARWETRISEMRLLGPVGHALFTQQVATCYAARRGAGSRGWGSRTRKAAMWNILAANAWLDLGKFKQAQKCLNQASNIYNGLPREDGLLSFSGINAFVCLMIRGLKDRTAAGQDGKDLENTNVTGDNFVDEEREDFDHGSRRSMIGTGFVPRVDYDLESTNSPQGMEENDGSREEQSE